MRQEAAGKASSRMTDGEIVRRVCAGDHGAFEQLMRRYNRPLYRTARSILRNDAEAEDALQEAYLQAYRAMGGFRAESELSTWLTRIVVNEALARLRKTSRRAEIVRIGGEPEWEARADEAAQDPAAERPEQPDQAALRAEVRRLIERKIDDLPDAFRTVFMLRALEEMTVEETAACLDIAEATVRTRYFRAKGLLRESLSQEIDFALDGAFSFDGARCDRIVSGVLARLAEPPRAHPDC